MECDAVIVAIKKAAAEVEEQRQVRVTRAEQKRNRELETQVKQEATEKVKRSA